MVKYGSQEYVSCRKTGAHGRHKKTPDCMALQTGDYVDVPSCKDNYFNQRGGDTIIIHKDLSLGNR